MALTDKQLIARQQSIGGSDIPAILGISPFKSAADVFFEKTHQMEQIETEAMEAGHMLEPVVIDWTLVKLGLGKLSWSSANVRRTKILKSAEGLEVPAHANLDFMFTLDKDPVGEIRCSIEAKTTSLSQYWGLEKTDEVPDYVMAQCLWQGIIADLSVVYVGVLIGDRGFHLRTYKIRLEDYEEETIDIVNRSADFWNKNVMEGVAPEDTAPKIETLKKIMRVPNKSVELPDMMVQSWLIAKEEVSAAQKKEKMLKATMLSVLSDAEEGRSLNGTLTYYEYDRREYMVPSVKYRSVRWHPRKD